MARIYSKNSDPKDTKIVARRISSVESRFSPSNGNSGSKSSGSKNSKLNWNLVGIIVLLLILVALPICISIWDVGTPVKGYHS